MRNTQNETPVKPASDIRFELDQHEGKITVQSVPGQTTFEVWLPVGERGAM